MMFYNLINIDTKLREKMYLDTDSHVKSNRFIHPISYFPGSNLLRSRLGLRASSSLFCRNGKPRKMISLTTMVSLIEIKMN